MCGGGWVCTHVWKCPQNPEEGVGLLELEINLGLLLQKYDLSITEPSLQSHHHLSFWDRVLPINTELINLSKIACQKVPAIFLLLPPKEWVCRCILPHPVFCVGACIPNSDPHPCMLSSLFTEASLQLLVRWFMHLNLWFAFKKSLWCRDYFCRSPFYWQRAS